MREAIRQKAVEWLVVETEKTAEEFTEEVLVLFREEVEKVENPIEFKIHGGGARFSYEYLIQKQHDAVEDFRQKILSLLKEI